LGNLVLGSAGTSAYEAVPEFLSPAERSFFGVLQQAVASEYQIFAKVRLADVFVPSGIPAGADGNPHSIASAENTLILYCAIQRDCVSLP
jgi:hypothetical protein